MKKVLFFIATLLFTTATQLQAQHYYVSTTGNDINPGTRSQPFKTIEKALRECVPLPNTFYHITVEEGVYVIDRALELTPNTLVDGGYPVGFGDIQGALLAHDRYRSCDRNIFGNLPQF